MQNLLSVSIAKATEAAAASDRLSGATAAAIYCARRGDDAQATQWIASIRAGSSGAHQSECVASANLAEGVLAFAAGELTVAADKLRRAESLSLICRNSALTRHIVAWAAHIELNAGRFESVPAMMERAFRQSEPTEHLTRGRVYSTLAMALHHADRFDLAKKWYDLARAEAAAVLDDQGIDAVLHNAVAFRVNNALLASIRGEIREHDAWLAEQEYRTSTTYDAVKGHSSFRWSLPLIGAQLAVLRLDFVTARQRLQDWIAAYADSAPDRFRVIAETDLCWALVSVGEHADAAARIPALDRIPCRDLSFDEAAIVQFRRHQIAAGFQNQEDAAIRLAAASESLARHCDQQAQLVASLQRLQL